ncbi:MAG TPA: hypothetical protein VFG63_13490 [Nocardioidaceae bacterium]|nr:hypothetical protein [Nocardioidaceae bacterium]
MTPLRITIVLTVLAAVVVVLTRVRLSRNGGEAAGRLAIPSSLLNTHTGAGVLALLTWTGFLVTGSGLLGWVGLVLWWVTVAAGLLILARWMPARGRHSSGPVADTWGEGPGLSVLAHVGLLVGVGIFTVLLVLGEL